MSPQVLLIAHAAATLAMVGLIWFVQVVHYPLFASAGAPSFSAYARRHQQRTGLVVVPLMLTEAATAGLLVALVGGATAWLGVLLLAAIWASTALVQVPMHRRLARGFEPLTIRLLVRTNWLRTALWTARGGVAIALLGVGSGSA